MGICCMGICCGSLRSGGSGVFLSASRAARAEPCSFPWTIMPARTASETSCSERPLHLGQYHSVSSSMASTSALSMLMHAAWYHISHCGMAEGHRMK